MIVDLPMLAAAAPTTAAATPGENVGFWLGALGLLALLPFLLTMVTSFAKLVIVGGILRQALGTQQVPPTTVITGLALILTLHIMWPVVDAGLTAYEQQPDAAGTETLEDLAESFGPPLREFLRRNTSQTNYDLFLGLRENSAAPPTPDAEIDPADGVGTIRALASDLTILAPAFVLTELTEAFQIGFLLFVPFLVLDIVVSNLLLAMGMHMLSPVTVSLPLKLLLFVLIDGWTLIFRGLITGYNVPGAADIAAAAAGGGG